MISIYKITRLDTGRAYVGLSANPETRWRKHKNAARQEPLTKAELMHNMHNLDLSRFKFEIIESVPTEAAEREIFWIAQLKETKTGVYNMTPGGGWDNFIRSPHENGSRTAWNASRPNVDRASRKNRGSDDRQNSVI